MVLVAPGICRYTVHGRFAGRDIANILDMQVDTTGGTVDRDEALDAIAGDILNNWDDHVLALVTNDYSAVEVSWVDLDEEDGPTGSRSSTSANTWPAVSANTLPPLPANVAGLVRKQIVGTRGRRSGRMYLCGLAEAATEDANPNRLAAVNVSTINAGLNSFRNGINDAEGPTIGIQRQLVVVHTRRPTPTSDPIYTGYSPVSALTIDPLVATQRRRLRG